MVHTRRFGNNKIEVKKGFTIESGEGNASKVVLAKGWNQHTCRKAVTKMIIISKLRLSFVDNKGFGHFCSLAIPQFIIPSRTIIDMDIMDLFLVEKTMMRSLIRDYKQ